MNRGCGIFLYENSKEKIYCGTINGIEGINREIALCKKCREAHKGEKNE